MDRRIDKLKAGLVLGALAAGWTAGWLALIVLGLAQPLLDLILWMHFIAPVYRIEPFDLFRAALSVILTGGVGFTIGAIFASIWNAGQTAR